MLLLVQYNKHWISNLKLEPQLQIYQRTKICQKENG